MRRNFFYVLLFAIAGSFFKCVYPEQYILYVYESSLSFPAFNTRKEVHVNANVSTWQVSCDQTWCTVTKTIPVQSFC